MDALREIDEIFEKIPLIEPTIPLVHIQSRAERVCRVDLLSPPSFEEVSAVRKHLLQTASRNTHVVSTVSARRPVDGVVAMRAFGCDLNPEEPDPHYRYIGGALILNAPPQMRSELQFDFTQPGEYLAEICLDANGRNAIVKLALRRPIADKQRDIWMWHHDHYLVKIGQDRLVFRCRIEGVPRSPLRLQFLSFGNEVTLYWASFVKLHRL